MEHAALGLLQALEASAFGAAIRQAVWIYPVANITHVVAVVIFAGAMAVMDVRLLGGLAHAPASDVVRSARRVSLAAFALIAITGFILFAAEASHVGRNAVFQTKLLLIGVALINVLAFELFFRRKLADIPPLMPLPFSVRASAFVSLATWLAVVACGRSIAYF